MDSDAIHILTSVTLHVTVPKAQYPISRLASGASDGGPEACTWGW
jgi:hypothetical protein